MKDQADRLRKMAQDIKQQIESEMHKDLKHTRVIVISSGKGGAGKSTLALNLSLAFAQKGIRVVLMDADLGLANIDIMLGLVPKYNLFHMLQGRKEIKDIIIKGPENLDIIPGGSGISELANLRQADLQRVLLQMGKLDGMYDYMVVDTGAGLSEGVITFLLAADDAIIVTTPEPTSITDAYGIVKSVSKHDYSGNLFLVVNRVADSSEGVLVAEKFKLVCERFLDLTIKPLGYVLNDVLVEEGIRRQKPFIILHPRSQVSRNIRAIADNILEGKAEITVSESRSSGIKGFFKKLAGTAGIGGGRE